MLLSISKLSKKFYVNGRRISALSGLEFGVKEGEFVIILGPSGCGKSTLLRILAGLERPDEGHFLLDGRPLRHEKERRGCGGYMPQRDALLPWRTVLGNVILGPELNGEDPSVARQRAGELMALFGLKGFEHAWPATLSGGMRQRAALLRTFLTGREILLLDEPFGALDMITRRRLQQWLEEVRQRLHKTILFITHDIDEALFLGDRILVFSPQPGQIKANIDVDLARPRHEDLLLTPAFLKIKHEIMQVLSHR